jgi:formylglycine-generating enzyme required for sulfatase activity
MSPASGSLILYATEPGKVAQDGEGRNGIFTKHLLASMDKPGVNVETVFKQTAQSVRKATRGDQTPWMEGVILGQFYFIPVPPGAPGARPMPPVSIPVNPNNAEIVFWQSVEKNPSLAGYQAYLQSWPNGRFASLASLRLKELEAQQKLKTIPFTVKTNPEDARVRILNIGPKYHDGIQLAPGRYHIEVTKRGYEKQHKWFELSAKNAVAVVDLENKIKINTTAKPTSVSVQKSRKPFEPEMVNIRGGSFQMGSPSNEVNRDKDERQHPVSVRDFEIGKYEVTQKQWRAVMGVNPSYFKGCDNCPVETVSWKDIQDYINRLNSKTGKNYRLPTEAEWEYAARAGTTGPFSFSGPISTDKANYDGNYTYDGRGQGLYRKKTTPVGSFLPNPWGLYDVHGNVWEWTCSEYDKNYGGAETRCVEEQEVKYVLRGGSFGLGPRNMRSANRITYGSIVSRGVYRGFRLARTLNP